MHTIMQSSPNHLIKYAHINNCTYIQHTYIHHHWTCIQSTLSPSSHSSSWTSNTSHFSSKEDNIRDHDISHYHYQTSFTNMQLTIGINTKKVHH